VLTQIAYSVLENFRGLNFRGRGQGQEQGLENKLVIEDPREQGLSSRTATLKTAGTKTKFVMK